MIGVNQQVYYRRWDTIPDPVREIARNNVLVQRICEGYARGHICVLEEALCQIIIGLAADWHKQRDDYIEMMRLHAQPLLSAQQAT